VDGCGAAQAGGLAEGRDADGRGEAQTDGRHRAQVDITVFERLGQAGGRARSIDFAGSRVEVGASLLHSSGKLSKELLKLAGCKQAAPGFSVAGQEDSYGFITDKGFAVLTSSSRKVMAAAVLGYVGPAAAMKVLGDVREKATKWQQVYQLLADGQDFDTPQQLFAALGLSELTQISVRQHLDRLGVNKRMAGHIIEPVLKAMYSQGAEINALAGLVALTGAGLAGGKLFAISKSNFTLYDKLLRHIGAKLRLNTEVKAIRHRAANDDSIGTDDCSPGPGNGGFEVVYADGSCEGFDAVVLAAPYAFAVLELQIGRLNQPDAVLPYFDVDVTLVAGRLNPAYFKVKPGKALPNLIFTADSAGAPFGSIGICGFSPIHNMPIYRITAPSGALSSADGLDQVFAEAADICHFNWHKSCPRLTPDTEPRPFVLASGLFYACALDGIASTLELASIGGWNSGGLALRHLDGLQ
jgi:hypothetical protein